MNRRKKKGGGRKERGGREKKENKYGKKGRHKRRVDIYGSFSEEEIKSNLISLASL